MLWKVVDWSKKFVHFGNASCAGVERQEDGRGPAQVFGQCQGFRPRAQRVHLSGCVRAGGAAVAERGGVGCQTAQGTAEVDLFSPSH